MIEKLHCSCCNAVILTSFDKCEYCGSNYKTHGDNGEVIRLKKQLDKLLSEHEAKELLIRAEKSIHREHPIIRFRIAKAKILLCLFDNDYIIAHHFCEVLKIINELAITTSDYIDEFLHYISIYLPSPHTSIDSNNHKEILAFIIKNEIDKNNFVKRLLTEQLLQTELGVGFMKEYRFYTDKKNFINNPDFRKKKEHLEKKYAQQKVKTFANISID